MANVIQREVVGQVLRQAPRGAVDKAAGKRVAAGVVHGLDKLAVGAASRQAAVGRIEARIAAEKAAQGGSNRAVPGLLESQLQMQPRMESLLRMQPGGKAKGTVVLMHGYTAGPWQFEALSKRLVNEGYNVYAPRLPGHGFVGADGIPTGEAFLNSTKRGDYDKYLEQHIGDAIALGAPVTVAGLSGGADLALRSVEKYPQLKGAFVMAPFSGPILGKGILIRTLLFLDKVTFGLVGRVLDLVPYNKNALPTALSPMPHSQSSFGAAANILEVGAGVKDVVPPVQFVTTEGDRLAGTSFVRRIFDRVGGAKGNGWFHFGAEAKVPHAMISAEENKSATAVKRLEDMIVDFADSNRLVNQPPA